MHRRVVKNLHDYKMREGNRSFLRKFPCSNVGSDQTSPFEITVRFPFEVQHNSHGAKALTEAEGLQSVLDRSERCQKVRNFLSVFCLPYREICLLGSFLCASGAGMGFDKSEREIVISPSRCVD